MSHFICEHCGAHIVDSPTGYLSGCRHYPMEQHIRKSDNDYCNAKLNDPCAGCKWDSDKDACNHPQFDAMVEAGIIADCREEEEV